MNTVRVIVNADDLGMSERVNSAIFELIEAGRVTSTTLLTNGPSADAALRQAAKTRGASFGVHLNATQFRPLTDSPALRPLLDGDGLFAGTVRSSPIDRSLKAALGWEFEAQIEKVRAAGITVSHLDSHHHIHTLPALRKVLADLRKRLGISRVRPTRLHYGSGPVPTFQVRAKKTAWNLALKASGARCVDVVTDLRSYVDRPAGKPGQWVELMVHPGSDDHREEEELLRAEWWTSLPFQVEFGTYAEL